MELVEKLFEKAMDKNKKSGHINKTDEEVAVLLWFSVIQQVESYKLCYTYKLQATDALFDELHNNDSDGINELEEIKKEVGDEIVDEVDADLLGGI